MSRRDEMNFTTAMLDTGHICAASACCVQWFGLVEAILPMIIEAQETWTIVTELKLLIHTLRLSI